MDGMEEMASWLSPEELEFVRHKVPMLYVNVVPVRLGETGQVEAVGLLLQGSDDSISRSIVSGRVLFHETVRAAVVRHLEKDLGLMALPRIPASMVPFTIGEYFPTPGEGFFDSRQHAVALCYVVPISGDCSPQNDALGFTWFDPGDLYTRELCAEMTPGHADIVKRALAFLGYTRERL
ncbi:DUF4916 domain-containing protein [Arcanobacterium canis]|uniref:DUF4916 domain-containing protein n=1 Tax=Arcanobacterium canis TaxID=999183 RepID=A0ABY8FZK3_9ACTO|nr:DUF4916 domain-containing protein [Arcanobacterium canis]WFM83950.1 DUF4916 domain-containing protein [Arcanobacterium canis]